MTLEKFLIYNAENPQIYEMFKKFTIQAIGSGRGYFGTNAIIERLRWYSVIEAKDDTFKINNDIAPFYSRMFEKDFPEHKGFFRKRRSIADRLV